MRTTIVFASVLLGGIACTGAQARAVDLPPRKPGLWEVTLHLPDKRIPPQVTKVCTDAATDARLFKFALNMASGKCNRTDIQRSGDVVTMELECKPGETTIKSHIVMTFASDSAYKIDAQTHFEPPIMGRGESHVTQDARWAGPCPADMQPGDMIGPHGVKTNLNALAHLTRSPARTGPRALVVDIG